MVLELPELARENQNWKIYRVHILDSAAAEGVVSHLAGATPKPVDSRKLEAWNWSNSVAKYIVQDVISDSLLARLMHHELAHTLFSHLAAIFGDHEPIAIEPPAERSDQDEPLCEDSHPKSDSAYSARTAYIVEGNNIEEAGAATRIAHDTDRDNDYITSLTSELETTEIHDRKPSGTTPTGIPNIPSTPSTNTTIIYPKDPPNAPDGMLRGDNHETAENGGQWQRTVRKVNRNDGMASPAPNLADRTSRMTTGDGPTPSSRKRPKNAVKHQRMSTRYIPLQTGRANANAQRSNGQPKPKIHLPRRHRPPLDGERYGVTANGYTPSSSGQSMPQKRLHTPNEPGELVTVSIESEKPHSGGILRVRLAGVRWHTDDTNSPGRRTDLSHGQADELRGSADALNASNNAKPAVMGHRDSAETYLSAGGTKRAVDETDGIRSHVDTSIGHRDTPSVEPDALNTSNNAGTGGISHGDEPNTYLGAGGAKCGVDAMDGTESHTDASSGHGDTQSVQTDAITTVNAPEIVSTHPIEPKRPNSPVGDVKRSVDVADGLASHTDTSSGHMDAPSVRTDALTPANEPQTIRIRPNDSKSQNSPMEAARQRSNEPNTCGNHANRSGIHTDMQSVAHETETPINALKIVRTRPNDPKPPNSPSGDAKRDVDETDGLGGHADASDGQADAPSVDMDAIRPANASKTVSIRQIEPKSPNLPAGSATSRSDATDGFGSHTDTSSVCTDMHCTGNDTQTATNEAESVRTRQNSSKMLNSPHGREIATPKYIYRWKRVSIGDGDMYAPQNTPIDTRSRKIVFGRVEGGVEAIAPKVVDETTGNGDGRRNGGDGGVNDTTSNVSVDSTRVKAALLATDSQQTRSRRITRNDDLPVSSWPPIQPADHPYGPARHQRRRGKLKIERINDKSISQAPEDEGIYLRRDPIAQPRGDDPQRSYRVIGPRRRRGRLKPRPTDVSQTPEDEKTYQGLHKPILPLPRDAGDPSRSTPIGHLPYSLQSLKNNLQKVSRDDKKSNRIKYAPECKRINNAQRIHRGHVTYQIR